MKFSRVGAVIAVVSFGVSLAIAQDSIRLQFEVIKDGVIVATPAVSATAGVTGRLDVADVGTVAFTPTLRGPDSVTIAVDIRSAGKEVHPPPGVGEERSGRESG